MTNPAATEQAILDELAVLPDPHERLAHLIRRAGRRPALPEAARVQAALVPGCVSQVWLTAALADGRCRFLVAADSPMVHGLMALLCDVYDGAGPLDAAAFASDVIARAGLDRALSPTRLHGLGRARDRIRILSAGLAGNPAAPTPSIPPAG